MATHSSVLAWRIPGTGEPDGLPSMGSHRVGHDWSDLAAAAAVINIQIVRWNIFPIDMKEGNFIEVWWNCEKLHKFHHFAKILGFKCSDKNTGMKVSFFFFFFFLNKSYLLTRKPMIRWFHCWTISNILRTNANSKNIPQNWKVGNTS